MTTPPGPTGPPATAPPPTHGWTRHGHAVHEHTHDHLPTGTAYQRLNKRVAMAISQYVMTMTTFWLFNLLALCSLPAILNQFSTFHGVFPKVIITASLIALIAWISSNWLQLVLLPALGVGQNLQSTAADVRAAETFEDVSAILDQLDVHTEGGLKMVLDRLDGIQGLIHGPAVPPTATAVAAKRNPTRTTPPAPEVHG